MFRELLYAIGGRLVTEKGDPPEYDESDDEHGPSEFDVPVLNSDEDVELPEEEE